MGWDGNWWDGKCDGMGELMPWQGGREDGTKLCLVHRAVPGLQVNFIFSQLPSAQLVKNKHSNKGFR